MTDYMVFITRQKAQMNFINRSIKRIIIMGKIIRHETNLAKLNAYLPPNNLVKK